ncbi:hypothetical protein [Paenibacillus sp. HB172176]|uniref:hypothetical protein n=1 Tax=Paenibacillus sp. HB172176 TaxID=2493690 RepID=UPI00143C6E40|nr:hypothetical protein [Paenibacillus sp. HB172176]
MRIRIIGSCGSGKSTLARQLSEMYEIPYYEIDNIIWDRSADNLKFSEELRNATFKSIIDSTSWIVEGVQYKDWTLKSIENADAVFILNPNVFRRDYRIIKRFILSRTGIRPWNYKQSVRNLCAMMIRWNHQYDIERVIEIVRNYRRVPYVVRNKKEVINLLKGL